MFDSIFLSKCLGNNGLIINSKIDFNSYYHKLRQERIRPGNWNLITDKDVSHLIYRSVTSGIL